MHTLGEWNPDDDVAKVVQLSADADWLDLVDRYTGGRDSPQLRRTVEVVRSRGAVCVLVETRYIDVDWRSEHSQFYSTTFARYASVCHRLHFFDAMVADIGDLSGMEPHYLGYSILRPIAWAPVGRTMVRPPPDMDSAVMCLATETVDVLGWPLSVTAMPFTSQDGQFLRCAHASIWMALHLMHLRQGLPHRTPADIQHAALGGVVVGRQVPSEGPSVHQMLDALTKLGISPGLLALPNSPAAESAAGWDGSLFAIVCRYINSNLPPIVVSNSHAWVMVGYAREPSAAHPGLVVFRHDDALGPYIRVPDPWNEPQTAHQPWVSAILPLPPKIFMTAERAEAVGRWWFQTHLASGSAGPELTAAASAGALTYMTYGLRGRDYKHGLTTRNGFPPELAREYRLSAWPRNIWVVEAVDRSRRSAGQPCVLGEVIIDPTANHDPTPDDPGILSTNASGNFYAEGPDHAQVRQVAFTEARYESGRRS